MATRPRQSAAVRRRAWSAHAERLALDGRAPQLSEAKRNYRLIDDRALKLQLAREIAQTRAPELTLGYRNLVGVVAGFKRKSNKLGKAALTREPCVIFIVRSKWRSKTTGGDQRLPSHVTAFADWQGRRRMVAVPTDVQLETGWIAATQGLSAVQVKVGSRQDFGTLACVVKVSQSQHYDYCGLSALHVLSPPWLTGNGLPCAGHAVQGLSAPGGGAVPWGTSILAGGMLPPSPDIGFDAQLANLTDWRSVRKQLGQQNVLSLSEPFVQTPARFDELVTADGGATFEILIPDNHPKAPGRPRLFAVFDSYIERGVPIAYQTGEGGERYVSHFELLKLAPLGGQTTRPGDSGSLVVLHTGSRYTIVGMHIAGGNGFSCVLPAWQLFSPFNYRDLPEGCEIFPM